MQLATAQQAAQLLAQITPLNVAVTFVQNAITANATITGCDMSGQPHFAIEALQLTAAESATIGQALIAVLQARLAPLNAQLAAL